MISKEDQRKIALFNRRNLSENERADYSRKICKKLNEIIDYYQPQSILAYSALWDEADISDFCQRQVSSGVAVSYPVSKKNGIMDAYVPASSEDWQEGLLGIRIPNPKKSKFIEPAEIDIVIVPLVAFDEGKRRLGHGGGYYDRYLPKCKNARFIAAAFEAQKLDEISVNEYDILMDAVVTEKKIY